MENLVLLKSHYFQHTVHRSRVGVCQYNKLVLFLVVVLVNVVLLVITYSHLLRKTPSLRPVANISLDRQSLFLETIVQHIHVPQLTHEHKRLLDDHTQSTVRTPSQEEKNLQQQSQHPQLDSLQQQQEEQRQKRSLFNCETLLLSCDYHDVVRSPIVEVTTGTQIQENLTIPQQNHHLRLSPRTGEVSRQSLNISRWCGRDLQLSDTSAKSFTQLSQWLSSGGVNLVRLLNRSIIPCSLECPASDTISTTQRDKNMLDHTESSLRISSRLSQAEMEILQYITPVEDYHSISNENTSRVTLLSSVSVLKSGSVVSLRVDLYDGSGKSKTQGGDEIRVWISDPSIGAGSPGKVYDLNNGSYLANVTVRWSGGQKVAVSLHHPREIMRTMMFLRHALGTMRYLTSAFENGNHGQVTPCMWYPIIPGYDDICDLTSMNGGLPWFCGKPGNRNLTCADWTRAQAADFVAPLPVTRGEEIWLDKMNREPYIRIIPFSPSDLTVTADTSLHIPDIPCWRVAHSDTWKHDQPSGWFYNWKWRSAMCNSQDVEIKVKQDWLRNKSVYLLGDSNMKNMFQVFRRQFCTINAVKELPFPGPMNCSNPEFGFRVFFMAHAHPFNLPHPDHFRKYNRPLSAWLDQIHTGEDALVVCHLYLHFSQFTIPLYELHVQDVLSGVKRLLHRNPNAMVVIRGTHVAYKGWPVHAAGGDVLAQQFNQILKQIFTPLHDRVMYLNGWDMTLAIANLNFHPERYVDESLVDNIFSHFIGR